MRSRSIATLAFLLLSVAGFGQQANPNYDAELAERLGADDYGMKSYILVMLKTGSNTDPDEALRNKSFQGHMSNMNTMVEAGQLIVAGPLGANDKDYRGIFILNVSTKEEAIAILKTDPAIAANYLEAELFDWYGSAALSEYLKASDKVGKFKF